MKLKIFEPEETNAFQFYFDIGFKCNMNCSFCYDFENRHSGFFKGTTKKDLIEVLDKVKFRKQRLLSSIVIFGGEPTIYDELLEIIPLTKEYPIEFVIATNGLRIATDNDYAKELFKIADRRVSFTTDWTWGSDSKFGEEIYNRNPDYKWEFLEQLRRYKRKRNQLVNIITRDYNTDRLNNILDVGMKYHDVISAVGFHSEAYEKNMLRTKDFLDILINENITTRDEINNNTIVSGEMFKECGDKRCCIRFKYKNKFIIRFIEFDANECWMRNHILPNNKLAYMFEYVIGRNSGSIENIEEVL